MTDWVLLDQTGGATTADGDSLTPEKLTAIAAAVELQLNRDYAPHCGSLGVLVRAGSSPTDAAPGEKRFILYPTLDQAPGAIAYHDTDGLGEPEAFDAITLSDTLLGVGNSLSVAISHELLEAEGNPGVNLWADDGQGHEFPRERCDAVETQSYPVTVDVEGEGFTIYVSNFLLDAFFVPNHAGPYDFIGLVANDHAPEGPFQTASGGGGNYQYVRDTAPSSQTQVRAIHGRDGVESVRFARRAPKRAHPRSRAAKLGYRPPT